MRFAWILAAPLVALTRVAHAAEAVPAVAKKSTLEKLLPELIPLGILLAVVILVILMLPRIDVGHSKAYLRRRVIN